MPDPSPSTLTVNFSQLQLPTARKKEWWPATADSLPQAVITVIHTTSAGSEPTTVRFLVRRATSSATDSPMCDCRSAYWHLETQEYDHWLCVIWACLSLIEFQTA